MKWAKINPRIPPQDTGAPVPVPRQGQGSKTNRVSDWNQRMEDVEASNVKKVEQQPPPIPRFDSKRNFITFFCKVAVIMDHLG